MKRVVAFIGSARRQATYRATKEFEEGLKSNVDVEFEYVFLSDMQLEFCRGCKLCLDKGEELCPIRDDLDALVAKMEASDGVVFASPNYAFHISARMKNLLDRLAFFIHRPHFFGKTFTAIVVQGVFGGNSIAKYLTAAGENMGFQVTKGCCVTMLEPPTQLQEKRMKSEIRKASARFSRKLASPSMPTPSLLRLMMFRMSRSAIKKMLDERYKDYRYYKENGWFESDYYHQVSLGPAKKLVGFLSDFMGRQM